MALSTRTKVIGGLIITGVFIFGVAALATTFLVPLILVLIAAFAIYMIIQRLIGSNPQGNHEKSSHCEILNNFGPNQSPTNELDNGLSEEPGQHRNFLAATKPSTALKPSLVQAQQSPIIEESITNGVRL